MENLARLNSIAKKALSLMKAENSTLAIFLVTETEMSRLNRTWRNKDKSTNVLAFPYSKGFPSPESKKTNLGEIYLAPAYIKKHNENINFMLVHGILHLLGFNHIKKNDRIEMEKLERKLLSKLNSK